jgi:hypothetical protein
MRKFERTATSRSSVAPAEVSCNFLFSCSNSAVAVTAAAASASAAVRAAAAAAASLFNTPFDVSIASISAALFSACSKRQGYLLLLVA